MSYGTDVLCACEKHGLLVDYDTPEGITWKATSEIMAVVFGSGYVNVASRITDRSYHFNYRTTDRETVIERIEDMHATETERVRGFKALCDSVSAYLKEHAPCFQADYTKNGRAFVCSYPHDNETLFEIVYNESEDAQHDWYFLDIYGDDGCYEQPIKSVEHFKEIVASLYSCMAPKFYDDRTEDMDVTHTLEHIERWVIEVLHRGVKTMKTSTHEVTYQCDHEQMRALLNNTPKQITIHEITFRNPA